MNKPKYSVSCMHAFGTSAGPSALFALAMTTFIVLDQLYLQRQALSVALAKGVPWHSSLIVRPFVLGGTPLLFSMWGSAILLFYPARLFRNRFCIGALWGFITAVLGGLATPLLIEVWSNLTIAAEARTLVAGNQATLEWSTLLNWQSGKLGMFAVLVGIAVRRWTLPRSVATLLTACLLLILLAAHLLLAQMPTIEEAMNALINSSRTSAPSYSVHDFLPTED